MEVGMRVTSAVWGFLFALHGVAAPLISPEFSVAPSANKRSELVVSDVAVATNGAQFFNVWLTGSTLLGQRVAADGSVIDQIPNELVPDFASSPTIAWGSDSYLLVWVSQSSIQAMRLAPNGAFLGNFFTVVATGAGRPSVAWNGVAWVVAWNTGSTVRIVSVSATGTVGTPVDVESFVAGVNGVDGAKVACSPANCLVAWERHSLGSSAFTEQMAFARFDQNLQSLGTVAIDELLWWQYVRSFSVAWNGTRYLVSWIVANTGYDHVEGVRVDQSGVVEDLTPRLLGIRSLFSPLAFLDSAGGDHQFVVMWSDSSGTVAARMADDGSGLDVPGAVIDAQIRAQGQVVLAWNGSEYWAAWLDSRQRVIGLDGTRLAPNLVPKDARGFGVSCLADSQSAPAIIETDGGYFAAWVERREGGVHQISAAQLSLTGDVNGRATFVAPGATNQYAPAIARGGGVTLVTWQDHRNGDGDIFATRLGPDGQVLDDGGFPICVAAGTQAWPTVSWNGSEFVVAWEDGRNADVDLFSAHVTPGGVVTADVTALIDGPGRQGRPFMVPLRDAGTMVLFENTGIDAGIAAALVGSGSPPLQTTRVPNDWTRETSPRGVDTGGGVLVLALHEAQHTDALDVGVMMRMTPDSNWAQQGDFGQMYSPAIAPLGEGAFAVTSSDVLTVTALDSAFQNTFSSTFSSSFGGGQFNPAVACIGNKHCMFLWEAPFGDGGIRAIAGRTALFDEAPTALDSGVTTPEDVAIAIALQATDVDDTQLAFSIEQPPEHGVLQGTPPNVNYTPAENFNGIDSFSFSAHDGWLDSGVAIVVITVTPVNDAPVATPQTLEVDAGAALSFTLTGVDVEGAALAFSVVDPPAHGTLEGTPPEVTYRPASGFAGHDSMTFKVNDGSLDSAPATITLKVNAGPDTGTPDGGTSNPSPESKKPCGCTSGGPAMLALLGLLLKRRKSVR